MGRLSRFLAFLCCGFAPRTYNTRHSRPANANHTRPSRGYPSTLLSPERAISREPASQYSTDEEPAMARRNAHQRGNSRGNANRRRQLLAFDPGRRRRRARHYLENDEDPVDEIAANQSTGQKFPTAPSPVALVPLPRIVGDPMPTQPLPPPSALPSTRRSLPPPPPSRRPLPSLPPAHQPPPSLPPARQPLPSLSSAPRSTANADRLESDNLAEVLGILDGALSHTPYAICGLAALAVWGLDQRPPSHISVLCPAYSRETIRCWASTHGMRLYPTQPDVIGVTTSDGRIRGIQLKFLPDGSGFDDLRVVRPSSFPTPYAGIMGTTIATRAKVLDLSSLLDLLAQAYVRPRNREVYGAEAEKLARARRAMAQDIFWILFRIIDGGFLEDGAAPLTEAQVPHVVDSLFWEPFVRAHPDAVEMFATAGLVRSRT